MNRFRICLPLFTSAILVAQTTPVRDRPERGILPTGTYAITAQDTINPVTGSAGLSVPLGKLAPGPNSNYGLGLYYSSALYDISFSVGFSQVAGGAQTLFSNLQPSEQGGWHYGHYGLVWDDRKFVVPGDCFGADSTAWRVFKLSVQLPDGSLHLLRLRADGFLDDTGDGFYELSPLKTRVCSNRTDPATPTGDLNYFTSDGSFIRAVVHAGGASWAATTWSVYLPDGTRVDGSEDQEAQIVDRNGNTVVTENTFSNINGQDTLIGTYRYDPSSERWISVDMDSVLDIGSPDHVNVPSYDGAPMTTLVYWQYISGGGSYYCTIYNDVCSGPIAHRVVSEIELPFIGSKQYVYKFGYDTAATNGWGELNYAVFPSAGSDTSTEVASAAYQYQMNNAFRNYATLLENRVTSKTFSYYQDQNENTPSLGMAAEQWSYNYNPGGCAFWCTEITGSGNVKTKYHFYDNYSLSTWNRGLIYKIESSSGDVVEKAWLRNRPYQVPEQDPGNPYVRTEFHTSGSGTGYGVPSLTASARYTYDRNGNVKQTEEYEMAPYTASFQPRVEAPLGTLRRTTTRSFALAPGDAVDSAGDANASNPIAAYWHPQTPLFHRALASESKTCNSGCAGNLSTSATFTYDDPTGRANLIGASRYDNQTGSSVDITHAYDSRGAVTDTWNGRHVQAHYDYDSGVCSGLYPTEVYQAYGRAEQRHFHYGYNCASGLIVEEKDVDNDVSRLFAYDHLNRPVSITEQANALGDHRQYQILYWDDVMAIETRADLNMPGDGAIRTLARFDTQGRLRLIQKTDADGAALSTDNYTAGIKQAFRYGLDANGWRYRLTSHPYRTFSDATIGWTVSRSDPLGRADWTGEFGGYSVPAPLGTNGAAMGSDTTVYGVSGNYLSQTRTDADQKAIETHLDALGDVREALQGGAATTYSYDVLDNVSQVVQGSQTRTLTFSSLGRLVGVTNPEYDGSYSYVYDENGNLTRRTDPRGVVSTMTYDGLDRPTLKSYSDGTPTVSWSYDTASGFGKGRLAVVANQNSTTSYESYDFLGRVTAQTQTTDGNNYHFPNYIYDLADNLVKQTYPSGFVVSWDRDGAGRINQVNKGEDGPAPSHYASEVAYAPQGAVGSLLLGNGVRETRGYNGRLQLTSAQAGSLLTLGWDYGGANNNGDVRTHTISDVGASQTFSYDALNRLTRGTESGGGNWQQAYGYDGYGNRWIDLSQSWGLATDGEPNGASWYTAKNRLNGYSYDLAGNLLGIGGMSMAYDAEGRQKSGTLNGGETDYRYDGEGRRVMEQAGTEKTVYVYDAMGRLAAEYATTLPAVACTTCYPTTDALGSTRLVTDGGWDAGGAMRLQSVRAGDRACGAAGLRRYAAEVHGERAGYVCRRHADRVGLFRGAVLLGGAGEICESG